MTAPKLSNLDCTQRKAVKKGCVVSFGGTSTARVSRVRLGWFYTLHGMRPFRCVDVTVICS
jgi:hypothetical protein